MTRSSILASILLILLACRPLPSADVEITPPPIVTEPAPPAPEHSVISPGECPPDLAAEPSVYFGGTVRLPLPTAVGELHEFHPRGARSTGSVMTANCLDPDADAEILYMHVAELEAVPNQSIEQRRVQLLERFGYAETTRLIQGGEQRPGFELWAYDVPSVEGTEPAHMLMAVTVTNDRVYVILYTCYPQDWTVLVNTFVESATRAVFSPRS